MRKPILLAILAVGIAAAGGTVKYCYDACYGYANNAASTGCKSQGGCTMEEWDGYYDAAFSQCAQGICVPEAAGFRQSISHTDAEWKAIGQKGKRPTNIIRGSRSRK